MSRKKRPLLEFHGSLATSDGSDDVEFWRSCSTEEKFAAAWELIKYYYESKGLSHELRFSRTIETIGQVESRIRHNRRVRGNGVLRTARN
jgi:hypothetical protein